MNIPRELRSDFKQPAPSEAAKLQRDLVVFGTCVRDEQGRRVPLDCFFKMVEDPSVPTDEIHIVCDDPTGPTRHRIIGLS